METETTIRTLRHVETEHGPIPAQVEVRQVRGPEEPVLTARIEVRNGRPDLVEFVLKSTEGGRGLRTADLTRVNVDGLIRRAYDDLGVPFQRPYGARADRSRKRRPTGRPSKLDDRDLLLEVERVYKEAPRAPVQAVGALLGVKHRQASQYVQKARKLAEQEGRGVF